MNRLFSNSYSRIKAIWSLLLASGYLKVLEVEQRGILLEPWYHLKITNLETLGMFTGMFKSWFSASDCNYNAFVQALLQGNLKEMNVYMNDVAQVTFSSFDTGRHPSGKWHSRTILSWICTWIAGRTSGTICVEIEPGKWIWQI